MTPSRSSTRWRPRGGSTTTPLRRTRWSRACASATSGGRWWRWRSGSAPATIPGAWPSTCSNTSARPSWPPSPGVSSACPTTRWPAWRARPPAWDGRPSSGPWRCWATPSSPCATPPTPGCCWRCPWCASAVRRPTCRPPPCSTASNAWSASWPPAGAEAEAGRPRPALPAAEGRGRRRPAVRRRPGSGPQDQGLVRPCGQLVSRRRQQRPRPQTDLPP